MRSVKNSLIIFATPLASKPNVIRRIGPSPPITVTITVIAFLVPSERLENLSANFAMISIIGVTVFKNASPTGTIAAFKSSTDFLNLFIAESAVLPNSWLDRFARSSTEAPARSSTRDACVPSLVTF